MLILQALLYLICVPSPAASIGFMNYHYPVDEDDSRVIVCAYVEYPPYSGDCDIDFPFNISLATSDGSAGIDICH